MSEKTNMAKWIKLLKRYYGVDSIRRMYRKHKGSEHKLAELSLNKVVTRSNTLRRKIKSREMAKFGGALGMDIKYPEPAYKQLPKYKNRKAKKKSGVITLYQDEMKFNNFFQKDLKMYLQLDRYIGSDFSELEIILKTYHDEIMKRKQFETLIKGDSIQNREKSINETLYKANEVLRILNNDLYNSLPKEVKIKTIGELNRETEEKLKVLSVYPTSSYAELFKAIRNI